MKKSFVRSLGALASACAVLLVMAAPASAATATASITSGTIVITKGTSPVETITIGGTTTCPPAPTLTATVTSNSTGTLIVTGLTSKATFTFAGGNYIAVLTLGTATGTSGTYNHTTGVMTGLVVPVKAQLYNVSATTPPDPCALGTIVCTWNISLALASANFFAHTTSTNITFTGAGHLTLGGSCAAPFSTYTSGTATVTLNGHVTSVV